MTYKEFRQYFNAFAMESTTVSVVNGANTETTVPKLVGSVVHGGIEKILSPTKFISEYPCLWLNFPEMQPAHKGFEVQAFDASFVVLDLAQADDIDDQLRVMDAMETIVRTILERLHTDAYENNLFLFEKTNCHIAPRQTLTSDNLHGWFVSFSIETAY
jgi:hypothetical protein